MTNSEFDERLAKIVDVMEADRREWQQRLEAERREWGARREADHREWEKKREADRREWEEKREADRREWDVRFKRHDDILLVHAKLSMDNEREWKEQVADLWEVIKNHESRLDSDRDALRNLLASMDSLVKTVDDFIKGLNRENGQG